MPGALRPRNRTSKLVRILLLVASFFLSWRVLRLDAANITLADMAMMGAIFLMIANRSLNTSPFGSFTLIWLTGLSLMLGGLLFSTLINGEPLRWLIVAAQYLFGFLFVAMACTSENRTWMRWCTVMFVLGVALSQVIGIIASFTLTPTDTADLFGPGFLTGNGRIGAMTGEPNPNSVAIAFAVPMLVNAARHRLIPLALVILCAIALAWGLIASASFTGFAATAIALLVVTFASSTKRALRIMVPIILVLTTYVAANGPLPKAFEVRVVSALTTGNLDQAGTYTDRLALIAEGWQLANNTVLTGLGVDQFRKVSIHGAPVHHLHLLIFTEGGSIAFFGLVIMICLMGWLAMSVWQRNREDGAMALAEFSVFLIFTFSIPHMYSRLWIVPLWLALSVYYARSPAPLLRRNTGSANDGHGAALATPRQQQNRGRADR